MGTLPVLGFVPLLKATVWGGRLLPDRLGKATEIYGPIGESWELCDLEGEQSIVSSGALAGRSLESLCQWEGAALLGNATLLDGRFPLLLKFIDARETLSVQVHPDEAACARLGAGARPKAEAWYIVGAEPGACLYVGFNQPVDQETFAQAIAAGRVAPLLRSVPVVEGDLVFLPGGTVHAIGAGILLAEVQQASNTTYRIFDWNRVGLDGKSRTLHVTESLSCIGFDERNHLAPPSPDHTPTTRLTCTAFDLEVRAFTAGETSTCAGKGGPVLIMGVGGEGELTLRAGDSTDGLRLGQTRLVPAAIADQIHLTATGSCRALLVRV